MLGLTKVDNIFENLLAFVQLPVIVTEKCENMTRVSCWIDNSFENPFAFIELPAIVSAVVKT